MKIKIMCVWVFVLSSVKLLFYHVCIVHIQIPVFCSGYLEWWLDSTLHLVLFIQYILNSVSVAYICIIWEVVIPDLCGQNTVHVNNYMYVWVLHWVVVLLLYSGEQCKTELGLRANCPVALTPLIATLVICVCLYMCV